MKCERKWNEDEKANEKMASCEENMKRMKMWKSAWAEENDDDTWHSAVRGNDYWGWPWRSLPVTWPCDTFCLPLHTEDWAEECCPREEEVQAGQEVQYDRWSEVILVFWWKWAMQRPYLLVEGEWGLQEKVLLMSSDLCCGGRLKEAWRWLERHSGGWWWNEKGYWWRTYN